jgi:hypothetical protein
MTAAMVAPNNLQKPNHRTIMNASSLIRSAKLTAAEKSLIKDTLAEDSRIAAIIDNCHRPGDFDPRRLTCRLHKAVDEAIATLEAAPTSENAEKLHEAIMRRHFADHSSGAIGSALQVPLNANSKKLIPLAEKIVDAAASSAKESHGSQRKALVDAACDPKLIAQHDAGLSQVLANLEGERASARSHPIGFFQQHGLAD